MSLAERLSDALARGSGTGPASDEMVPDAFVEAAVLIAVTDRAEPGVLLTLRHAKLRRHAGQIAFPGGRVDPADASRVEAALREADEEIGLPPHAVEIVGTSDTYRTGTGYDILPVIGVVPPDFPLVAHEVEVEAVFEVPLAFLLARENHVRCRQMFGETMRSFYEVRWHDRRIWGITAGIIVNLASRLATFA